ncbi:DUF6262 family protein [Streptomyces sp. NPDC051018]|uniref:DUF6262 family protein n=1 Tax=Streptomyces sp. NPDC051018 TaxID=3365639 RepID=UPI0037919FB9
MTNPSAQSTGPQSQSPAEVLKEARRRDSRAKRARVLEAIRSLQQSGDKITHAAVARSAGVSSWLTYADGVREHVEAAIRDQVAPRPSRRDSPAASSNSLRIDLELAREEIRKLRAEREQFQRNAASTSASSSTRSAVQTSRPESENSTRPMPSWRHFSTSRPARSRASPAA